MLTRRNLLKATFMTTAAFAVAAHLPASAQAAPSSAAPAATGPFLLPALPYAYDALEPYIDAETMRLHHDKHHATYVKNLNAVAAMLPASLVQTGDPAYLVQNLLTDPALGIPGQTDPLFKTVRNSGGGHYNHTLFWQMMQKNSSGKPTRDLASAINKQFGSQTQFQEAFTKAALGQFGSGWAWLSLAPGGALRVEPSANQDSPWMMGRIPLLGIDVWEHAYYLKYQNRRADYIAAWYSAVNWDFVSHRYAEAMKNV